jgi:predicted house-cleaning noncanonical NTP pyrophosphatase (MazG superfamily)
MAKYFFNKLVRDKIPQVIKARGGSYEIEKVSTKVSLTLLKKKLIEESKEVLVAERDEILNELCDVLQILVSISELEKIKFLDIQKKMKEKEKTHGAYKKGVFLVWSDAKKGYGDKLDKLRNKK